VTDGQENLCSSASLVEVTRDNTNHECCIQIVQFRKEWPCSTVKPCTPSPLFCLEQYHAYFGAKLLRCTQSL
jgi:hypothetical protein